MRLLRCFGFMRKRTIIPSFKFSTNCADLLRFRRFAGNGDQGGDGSRVAGAEADFGDLRLRLAVRPLEHPHAQRAGFVPGGAGPGQLRAR